MTKSLWAEKDKKKKSAALTKRDIALSMQLFYFFFINLDSLPFRSLTILLLCFNTAIAAIIRADTKKEMLPQEKTRTSMG